MYLYQASYYTSLHDLTQAVHYFFQQPTQSENTQVSHGQPNNEHSINEDSCREITDDVHSYNNHCLETQPFKEQLFELSYFSRDYR